MYVHFKDKIPRQNISHLVSSKVLRYTALGPSGAPLKLPLSSSRSMTTPPYISTFSCTRLKSANDSQIYLLHLFRKLKQLILSIYYPTLLTSVGNYAFLLS